MPERIDTDPVAFGMLIHDVLLWACSGTWNDLIDADWTEVANDLTARMQQAGRVCEQCGIKLPISSWTCSCPGELDVDYCLECWEGLHKAAAEACE